MKKLTFILLGCISALLVSSQSFAETTMSQEGQYIFNSLGFYLGGVLVAFMAAGFCMLESGLVTTKSVSTIAAKIKNGQILILSATAPDTIEAVAHTNIV